MLIAFSGAQSSGKSTLLEECKKLPQLTGYSFVEEVTRRIKRENNVPINNDSDNYDYTQILITADHIKNMKMNNAVLDRCSLDGYIYTRYFFDAGKVSKQIYDFSAQTYLQGGLFSYDLIFYTDPNIPLVDDGVRSTDKQFRDGIINLFETELKLLSTINIHRPLIVRLKGNVKDRIETIKEVLKNAY